MAEDRWYRVAVPILEFVHENGDKMRFLNMGAIAAGTGLEPNEVTDEVERLCAAGYLTGPLHEMGTGGDVRPWFLENSHLGERRLREIGAWPSDDPYDALLELIERQIAATPDEATKSKLAGLRGSVADVGKATVAGILVQLMTGGFHP